MFIETAPRAVVIEACGRTPSALRQRTLQHSNIQKHPCFPTTLRSLDKEIVKRHRFYVRALMMPIRIERFALGYSVQKKFFVFLFDFQLAHA